MRYKNQLDNRFDRRSSHYIIDFEKIRPNQKNENDDDESNENIETFMLNKKLFTLALRG